MLSYNMKFILAKEGSDLMLRAVVEATQCAAVRTWEWSSKEPPQKSPPLDLRATFDGPLHLRATSVRRTL